MHRRAQPCTPPLLSPPSRRHQWRGAVKRSSGADQNLGAAGVLDESGERVQRRAGLQRVQLLFQEVCDVLPAPTILQ